MMEVEFAPRDIPFLFIEVKVLVVWLGVYQHSGVHGFIMIDFVRVSNGVADIDLPQEYAALAIFQHAKGATSNTEVCVIPAMLEVTRYPVSIPHLVALVVTIEQCEAAIPQRFYDVTQHPFEGATGNDEVPVFVLHGSRRFPIIGGFVTRVCNKKRRFGIDIYFYRAGIKLLIRLPYQPVMPGGSLSPRRFRPV